jgi:hypothetical protein
MQKRQLIAAFVAVAALLLGGGALATATGMSAPVPQGPTPTSNGPDVPGVPDTPEPGDTADSPDAPDVPGQPDLPEPGDTPDPPAPAPAPPTP